ncbi:hypothetical protein [Gordonia crocea]|nr:hypothetical protein [Gordonia crocea]
MTDDEQVFESATAAMRAELLAHCYRMLGSATRPSSPSAAKA